MSANDHIPQTSADPYEYEDERGIRISDSDWECPNCGDNGKLMHRPGSKNTCTTCFWVRGGGYNDEVLRDFPMTYRQAQRLLAAMCERWHGTPGDIESRLRQFFDRPEEAAQALRDLREVEAFSLTTLGNFKNE